MMGMWFLASAAGNFLASQIAKATANNSGIVFNAMASICALNEGGDIGDLCSEQKIKFIDVYTNIGLIAVGVAILLLIISPVLSRRMHQEKLIA